MKNDILEQLLAKRKIIDAAIEAVRKMEGLGILSVSSSKSGIASMSVYEGAVEVLKRARKPLTMREIIDAILASGKKISSDKPDSIISTTIYKALRDKKDCEIVKAKGGKWSVKK